MDTTPTKAMREEAQRYRDWKAAGHAGGTSVAARRASQILSGDPLSPATVRTMRAWFARHEVDKQGQGFSPGEDGYPSPGRVAWAAWGGDPGQSWSESLVKQMENDRELDSTFSAGQAALYEAYEEAAEDLGSFDQSTGAHGSHYMPESPFASEGLVCSNCAFFAGPRACEIVEGDIDPAGLCKFWIIPERLVGAAEQEDGENERPYAVMGERPYPREHAARLRDPDQYDRFRRRNNAAGKGVDFIFGIKSGQSGADLQAIRFRLSEYTADEARKWLSDNNYDPISFEAATEERTKIDGPTDTAMERAKPDELKVGDYVAWNSSGGMARGRIEHIMREGTLGVPDSEFSIDATAEDPAALIRIYRPDDSEDGESDWNATETLVGHRFSTLSKIDALRTQAPALVRAIGDRFVRGGAVAVAPSAEDDRTFSFPFSSEYPVERYFGTEILSHEADAADLARLNDGAPLLFNHDPNQQIGVVERAWMDPSAKRGYVQIRFGRGTLAQEKLADVRDKILRNVSFGYAINEMQERGNGTYVATKWLAHEVSFVTIPADPSVGLDRSLDFATSQQPNPPTIDNEALGTRQATNQAAEPASTPTIPMEATPDLVEIRTQAAQAERTRIAAITALGEQHQMPDLARELIDGGKSLDEARAAVLDKLGTTAMQHPLRNTDVTTNDVGLSDKETKRFSFVRALNYLANPGDAAARRAAEFEIEVGAAAATKYERSSNGIVVPNEVLRRDLLAGLPSAGGNLVADELLAGSFIDLLRNRLAFAQAGVTVLSGLQGNISIPRQSSASTAYWVGENVAPTESQQAIDQVNMTPKTCGAFVDYSRRLLLQSSIDVEAMVRNDLIRVIALELDRVAAYGTGSSNQPLGLVNTTGIGSQTITTYGTFEEYIGMETDVATANADAGSLRYIINAAARGALKSTAKSASAVAAGFVFENNEINGYPVIVSNQLANNDALFGDFSMMVMALWSGLDLTVDPYAGSTAGTVRIIALQDVDFGVKQPGAFCYGT